MGHRRRWTLTVTVLLLLTGITLLWLLLLLRLGAFGQDPLAFLLQVFELRFQIGKGGFERHLEGSTSAASVRMSSKERAAGVAGMGLSEQEEGRRSFKLNQTA